MRGLSRRWALSGIFMLMSLAGCGDAPQQPTPPSKSNVDERFATPEATFQTAKTAILRDDYATFCDCWSVAGRDQLAAGMVFIGNRMRFLAEKEAKSDSPKAAEAKKKVERITRFFEQHGFEGGVAPKIHLTDDSEKNRQEILKLVEPIEDRASFIVEALQLGAELSDRPNARLLQEDAKLLLLEIEDETVKGKIVQTRDGKMLERPARFVLVDGQWKFDEIARLLN